MEAGLYASNWDAVFAFRTFTQTRCGEEQMEQKAPDLRKKIARYRRSLAVMNDPDTIRMIEHLIKQTEDQIEAEERH